MFRPTRPAARRGTILIVVLALLSLFAVVGITIVFYAQSKAQWAITAGEAQSNPEEFPDNGRGALNAFLGGLLYGVPDSGAGLLNSIRGHDFLRDKYGYGGFAGRAIADNGVGTFHESILIGSDPPFDRAFLVNHRIYGGTVPMTAWFDPEYAGSRTPNSGGPNAANFIPKNAPYTYPDLKCFWLAAQCQATGEIFPGMASFYRWYAFRHSSQSATATGLEPPTVTGGNPNWTNQSGRYRIVRPRPEDHAKDAAGRPLFPYCPPNADNTYTGDVQNLPGAFFYNGSQYVARNDSIWIDIGAPVITLPNGRVLKPLIAPLILDLSGRLNLSVQGNRMMPVTGMPAPTFPNDFVHTSGVGLGPWEINLEKAFAAGLTTPAAIATAQSEARAIVAARGAAQARPAITSKAFAARYPAGLQLPAYSAVPWTGNGGSAAASLVLPGSGMYSPYATTPSYTPTYDATATPYVTGYDSTNAAFGGHPALFNPTEYLATGSPRGFPLGDTKLLSLRYAMAPSFYAPMDVGGLAPNTLRGSSALPAVWPPQAATQSTYRLDLAHANRMLFTTHGYGLDRAGLTPEVNLAQNANAAIGPIDVNRPLADYRNLADPINLPTAQPLGPNNMGNEVAARLDRQRFARDIFARLVIVTGLANGTDIQVLLAPTTIGTVNYAAGDVYVNTTNVAPGSAQYNALRALAQVAVNMVDYIDIDDISTPFVWLPLDPADPQNAANYAAAEIPNRMVFGVEKPRLVLKEAYAEVTNDPADPNFTTNMNGASLPAHVRFWLEFQNPTNPNPAGGVLGTGAVKVRDISGTTVYSPYQVVIAQGAGASASLRDPANANHASNVTGELVGVTPNLIFDFSPADATAGLETVNPANGAAAGGILVCAANVTMVQSAQEFNPGFMGAGVINATAPAAGTSSLTYTHPLMMALVNNSLNPVLKQHTVLLRRLANPHLPPSATNPYITVDFMDNVSTFDAITRAHGSDTNRTAKTWNGTVMGDYDPIDVPTMANDPIVRRHSMGKVQPYAGQCNPTTPAANAAYPTFTFPNSLVLAQSPVDAGGNTAAGVRHTFGRQNSRTLTAPAGQTYTAASGMTDAMLVAGMMTETIMTPYDWLVHLDRQLTSPVELLHVTAGKPHELTLQFIVPNGTAVGMGADVFKHFGSIHNLLTQPTGYATYHPTLNTQAYRALDLLRLHYGHQVAVGGRIPGKININAIQDKRVWDALFDAQSGNGFTQAQVDAMWTALMTSRTRNLGTRFGANGTTGYPTPIPGPSVYDMNADNDGAATPTYYDRPFLPLGAGTIAPYDPMAGTGGSTISVNPAPAAVTAFRGGIGLQDTLLRNGVGSTVPAVWNTDATLAHPYQKLEALRKVYNNLSTTSDVFAVWVTVGYFDATPTTSGVNGQQDWLLGKEYYREVPGDLRHKFFCIVDRSNVGFDAQQFASGIYDHASTSTRPFFTTLEPLDPTTNQYTTPAGTNILKFAAASGNNVGGNPAVQVYSDGMAVNIQAGSVLVIGTGADREIVAVNTVAYTPATGIATVTVSTLPAPGGNLQKNHYAGDCVSNIVPGNPGPRPSFDVAQYPWIVQHWSRVP